MSFSLPRGGAITPISATDSGEPDTLWLLGGGKLITPERSGGRKGGTWHEVGAPDGGDREVLIGSFLRPRNNQ